MPLPTNTSTSTCTIPTTNFLESAATPLNAVRKQEWEEPHPGRRLSYPNDTPTTWGVYKKDEGRRGGMAAEGRWPDYFGAGNFSFAAPTMQEKRLGRGRTRTVPQELILAATDSALARPEIQTAPLPEFNANQQRRQRDCTDGLVSKDCIEEEIEDGLGRRVDDYDIDAAIAPIYISNSSSSSPDMSGTDSDSDSNISGAPQRKRMALLQPLDTSFEGLHFTDFSNHLEVPMDIQTSSFSTVGSEAGAFSVMSPDGDLYGWNAILDRQTTATPNHEEFLASYQQRRASRSKRSLLQRVFSPGGQETSSNPPTSFSGTDYPETQGR